MSGTMMPIMCQILVVTQLNLKKRVIVGPYYLRCFTDMALYSRGGCYATKRRLQQYGRPYHPKHSPSYGFHDRLMAALFISIALERFHWVTVSDFEFFSFFQFEALLTVV